MHASIEAKVAKIREVAERKRAREWSMLLDETRAAWARFEELRDRDLDALDADEAMRERLKEGEKK